MFLNVGVRTEDSDFLRFLWFEDPFVDDKKVTAFQFLSCVWIDLQPVSFECYN